MNTRPYFSTHTTLTDRHISILPPLVAERIAAGEVVERPASIVKELVENSLDAGATEVSVHLEDGGKVLIEIIDNGSGIRPEELSIAIQRHATSKLKSVDDLDSILTLGFRGEALPSIAAVSQLTLCSRHVSISRDPSLRSTAYQVRVLPPEIPSVKTVTHGLFLGSHHGTLIRAEGLFSQIPARLKFLKSASAEVSHVREWMERISLTHPHVGFHLTHGDRTLLKLRPESEEDRIRALLADGEDYPLKSAILTAEQAPIGSGIRSLRIHWLQGSSLPQMRKLVQVINRRAVKDRLVQQALLNPFRQALLPGQFPAVALFLELDPDQIDVNVHPAKTEVRFLNSSHIFRAVASQVEELIGKHGAPAYVSGPTDWAAREPVHFQPSLLVTDLSRHTQPNPTPLSWTNHLTEPPSHPSLTFPASPTTSNAATTASESAEAPFASLYRHPLASGRYVGIVFKTYLLYDMGEELALVDQHAAHERIRFEKLKRRANQTEAPQALLIPEAVSFPVEWRESIEERLPLLTQMGFDTELFGDTSVLFRGIPAIWGNTDLRIRLKNLIERLQTVQTLVDETVFEKLASEACRSAIKAGDSISREQAEALVEQLFACEHPWNCPHGRPTVARVPQARLEEWFQRRVPT